MHSLPWLTEARHRRLGMLWLALLLLAGLLLAQEWHRDRIQLQTDIHALLPPGEGSPVLRAADQRVSAAVNQKLFLMLEGPDEASLDAAAQRIITEIRQGDLLQAAPVDAGMEAFGPALYAHRARLLSQSDRLLLQAGDSAALSDTALTQWMSPGTPLRAELLQQDPLLFFPRFLMERSAAADAPRLREGWPALFEKGRASRLLLLTLNGSPFSLEVQDRLTDWLEKTRHDMQKKTPALRLYATGTALFAASGSREAQHEIHTIGVGSTLGLIILILVGFRSPRPLLTEVLAVGAGCLCAFLATHLVFGEVYLITLVFGASLIGVSLDYSLYYLSAQAGQPGTTSVATLRRLMPGLFLGLLTTIAAYLCLALTPFPGLRQIAVFAATGLGAAWITGMLLLPRLRPLDTRLISAWLGPVATLRQKFLGNPRWRATLALAALALILPLLLCWAPVDTIKALQALDHQRLADDAAVRQRFGGRVSGQYFVITGADAAVVAQQEERLVQSLQALIRAGKLQHYQALSDWIPSLPRQAENIRLQQTLRPAAMQEFSAAIGLSPQEFQHWQRTLTLTPVLDLNAIPATHALSLLNLGAQARLVTLGGVQDYAAIAALATLPGVQFMDPVQDLSALFGRYRVQAQWLALAALGLLTLLLGWRYGWRELPSTMGPVVLSIITTFALLACSGVAINLFTVLAVFLILGIGVDYAIFYREAQAHDGSATLAVFLAMASSALGFGLLSLSHTPAISGFGLALLVGVVSSFIFATLLTPSRPVVAGEHHQGSPP